MSSDIPPHALMERLKHREDELKKRDKDLRLRDQQLRERADDLDNARQSVDSLMAELETREGHIKETERRLGTLAQREEEAISRDMMLSEREASIEDKLATLARREKEHAAQQRHMMREVDDKMQALNLREGELMRRQAELVANEEELHTKSESLAKRIQETDEMYRKRERQHTDNEVKNHEIARRNFEFERELENQRAELNELSSRLRAEQLELEGRERDVKWHDEEARRTLRDANAKKREVMQLETDLQLVQADLDVRVAEVETSRYHLVERDEECRLKLVKLEHADSDLRAREKQSAELHDSLVAREAKVAELEASAAAAVDNAATKTADANELLQCSQEAAEEVAQQQRTVSQDLHLLHEKERSLKEWIVELEFREAAVEKKESRATSYLKKGKEVRENMDVVKFNGAILNMSLEHLQGAYLGATLRTRAKKAKATHRSRVETPLTTGEADASHVHVERAGLTSQVDRLVEAAAAEFRDLSGGYATLGSSDRERLFTASEDAAIIEAIEHEGSVHDEVSFLGEFTRSPLPPQLASSASQIDSQLYETVNQWLRERQELVSERVRRVQTHRLGVLEKALGVLRGKIMSRTARREVLSLPFSDGTSLQALDDGFKARARTRLPQVVNSGVRPGSRQERAKTPAGDATTPSRQIHRTSSLTPSPSLAASPKARRAKLSPMNATERLIDALPDAVKHHYASPSPKAGSAPPLHQQSSESGK